MRTGILLVAEKWGKGKVLFLLHHLANYNIVSIQRNILNINK